jgi:hypothetical protein
VVDRGTDDKPIVELKAVSVDGMTQPEFKVVGWAFNPPVLSPAMPQIKMTDKAIEYDFSQSINDVKSVTISSEAKDAAGKPVVAITSATCEFADKSPSSNHRKVQIDVVASLKPSGLPNLPAGVYDVHITYGFQTLANLPARSLTADVRFEVVK